MCLEWDKSWFTKVAKGLSKEKNIGLLIADLTEIKELLLKVLHNSDFTPKPIFKTDIVNMDVPLLAKSDASEISKLESLLVLCCFFCQENEKFDERINKLSEEATNILYEVVKVYLDIGDSDYESGARSSIRNSIKPSSKALETNSEYSEHYESRIKSLEQELKAECDNKEKLKKLQIEMDEITTKYYISVNTVKEYEVKIKFWEGENENSLKKLSDTNKENLKLLEYKNTIKSLEINLADKDKEILKIKQEYENKENAYLDNIAKLNQQIEVIKEQNIKATDIKAKYDKLNKEWDLLKDVNNHYELLKQEYNELKNAVESKGEIQLPQSQSSKVEIEKWNNLLSNQEKMISSQNKKIVQYEAQIELLQKNQQRNKANERGNTPEKEMNNLNNINYAPDPNDYRPLYPAYDSYNFDRNTWIAGVGGNDEIVEWREKFIEMQDELKKCKLEKDEIQKQSNKKCSEMEMKFKKEFELISSAMYNLGSNFWTMKYDYEDKLSKNVNWWYKERQKELNGDF